MRKLYWLYVALALFVLITMASGLFLEAHVTNRYVASLNASGRFIARKSAYERLEQLATRVDALANAAFDDNRTVEARRTDMQLAAESFQQAVKDEQRRIAANENTPDATALMRELRDVEAPLRGVLAEARLIFAALEIGHTDEAAAHEARMNRNFIRVRKELEDVDVLSVRLHESELEQQAHHAEILRERYEWVIGVLIVASLVAAFLYGRRMLREVVSIDELRRHEEELSKLNTAFEHVIAGVSFVGKDKNFSYLNRTMAAALGYKPEELVGTPTEKVLHPDDLEIVRRSNVELREKGKSEIEIRALHRGGDVLDIRLLRVASFDQQRKYVGHYAFTQNITAQKQAEAALRKSEERFHFAARATSDLIWDRDLKTNDYWTNEALEHQFGYPISGDIDRTLLVNAIHPDDRDRVGESIVAALATSEQLWSAEYRFQRGDGVYADVLDHGYIVRDAAGEPLRMFGAMMDITERKTAERAYTTQILNSAADGIFGFDTEGRTTFVNRSAANLLGWNAEELIDKNIHDISHDRREDGSPYAWNDCPAHATLQTGEAHHNDREVFWRKDGTSVAVEYETTPIRDIAGKITGVVVTFRDISARRGIERMKDEFVSVVSHELRTPLTSIRGALGLMAGGRVGEIPEKAKRMLDIAVTNTDRLVRLINDILDIERMESGKITLSRQLCDASELMTQAIDLMRPLADKADVTLECKPCEAMLFADPDRLQQTFSNLLSNAVKFSPPRSTVTLSATLREGNVLFEVADRGRGIPSDKLNLVFERFQQVDASDAREKGGSGLGLAICRSIVEQHGGEIWAESNFGCGSRLRFTIPRTIASSVVTAAPPERTVMVCDDDHSVREIMTALLQQHRYRAVAVDSGIELLNRVSEVAPDVILLDLLMPGLNGLETLAVLKREPKTASIPVVIMSVFSRDDSNWPVSDLAGWIQKPLDEHTIVSALEHAFHPNAQKRVLLVEDDLDLARVIIAEFERHGVHTFHAATGRQAIELAQNVTPDLLILDLVLPDIDGLGVVDWFKDHDMLRSVPVVVYSAAEPTPSQRDRLKLGPTEFLTKSRVAPEEFERRVIHLLDNMIATREEKSNAA